MFRIDSKRDVIGHSRHSMILIFLLQQRSMCIFPSRARAFSRDFTVNLVGMSLIFGAVSVGSCLYVKYQRYRTDELNMIHKKTLKYLKDGYLIVNSVPVEEKKRIWDDCLLPRLIQHWSSVVKGFNISDQLTWPRPINGKAYETTLTKAVGGIMPKLVTDNYEVQAVTCYLYDPNIKRVHFGAQTHFKLRLLISPLWALFPSLHPFYKGAVILEGVNESWHLVNWPNPSKVAGSEIANSAHIDGGPNAMFLKGLPCNINDLNMSTNELLLQMALLQTSILFYCNTPGDLTKAEGMTGLYIGSHLAMIEFLRNRNGAPVDWYHLADAIKMSYAQFENSRCQVALKDGEAILVAGSLVHSLMWAQKSMPEDMPRVIQNCKIHVNMSDVKAGPAALSAIVNRIPQNSLIRQLYCKPIMDMENVLKEDEEGMGTVSLAMNASLAHYLNDLKRQANVLEEFYTAVH